MPPTGHASKKKAAAGVNASTRPTAVAAHMTAA